jgi:prephenate dehydratase
MELRVAIQGFEASFHEVAARKFFHGTKVTLVFCESFPKLFEMLTTNKADYAVMAIENTLAGSLLQNYNLLREHNFDVVGEILLHIVQNLMALPGTKIEDISEVHSHPIAIAQVVPYFSQYPHIKLVESDDTALSAKEIADQSIKGRGAVASRHAARVFGLELLSESIETHKKNFTRFLVLANNVSKEYIPTEMNKASLCFSLPHEEGSLASILAILSFYKINLTKIQSMPILGEEFEYFFYIDVTYPLYEKYKQAIQAIKPLTHNFKLLGEYKKADKIEQ